MSKVFPGLCIALFLFSGCATYNNAKRYYSKHPEDFARDCAGEFVAIDSMGEPVVQVIPGAAIDYTSAIDSLASESLLLSEQLREDSIKASQVSQDCAKLVREYQSKAEGLSAKISALNAKYKKPLPDTVKITVTNYQTPTGIVAKLKSNEYTIDSLDKQLAIVTAGRDEAKSASRKKTWIIAGLLAGLGIAVVLKFKNII